MFLARRELTINIFQSLMVYFGAILSLSFSLYAYVYILSRASFLYQSQNQIDLGRSLGFSKLKSLFSLILPSARPAIVAWFIISSNGDFSRVWCL
jgi:ABC-type Fe3+ transport system permease subunit